MNGGEADRLGSHLTGDQISQADTVERETKCLQINPRPPLDCTASSQSQAVDGIYYKCGGLYVGPLSTMHGNMVLQAAMSSTALPHFMDIPFSSADGQTVKRFLKFNF